MRLLNKIISEIYDTKELPGGMFEIKFNLIGQYQQKDPLPAAKFTYEKYKRSYFHGGQNTIDILMYK